MKPCSTPLCHLQEDTMKKPLLFKLWGRSPFQLRLQLIELLTGSKQHTTP